jgi:hypothetical protein
VEVRIGVQQAPRDIVLESNDSAADITLAIEKAISSDSLLTLKDDKGRTIVVPGSKIAFVEVGAQTPGKVGFAS